MREQRARARGRAARDRRGARAAALAAGGPAGAAPRRAADCLACHGEKDLTAERKGRTVSLYVSEKAFAASIHGSLQCVNCHADLEGKELPHDAPLKKVDCGACHEAEAKQHAASLHGKAMKRGDALAPTLRGLPRDARHPGGEGPALAGLAAQGALHLRQVPPGRHAGAAAAQHPPGPHPGELLGDDPRRGPAQEGPDRGRRTAPPATPPTTSCRTPTPRSSIARGNIAAHLHQVPRPDRGGAPQGDQGRAVGEGGARPAGLRRLPPAAQGAEGLLHAGHGGRGLPEVPPGEGPQGAGRPADVRGRAGAPALAARRRSPARSATPA